MSRTMFPSNVRRRRCWEAAEVVLPVFVEMVVVDGIVPVGSHEAAPLDKVQGTPFLSRNSSVVSFPTLQLLSRGQPMDVFRQTYFSPEPYFG